MRLVRAELQKLLSSRLIWVLLAVSVGGSLFGIIGMLVFIPLASVVYSLMRDEVNKRTERKKQKHDTGYRPQDISQ